MILLYFNYLIFFCNYKYLFYLGSNLSANFVNLGAISSSKGVGLNPDLPQAQMKLPKFS